MSLRGPTFTAQGLLFSAGSGLLATLALWLAPFAPALPVVPFPWTVYDIAPLLPIVGAVGVHAMGNWMRWPWPAGALPLLAVALAVAAHWQGSALLSLFVDVPTAQPGQRVDLLRLLLSGGSVLLALAAGLERGHTRLAARLRDAGLPEEGLRGLQRVAEERAARSLGFAAIALVALAFAASVGDAFVGGEQAPLPEALGAALAVGLAVLLFPGLVRAERERRG